MERQEIVNNNVFLRCSVCGEVVEREIRVPLLDGSGGYKKTEVHCVCKCQREKKEAYEKRLRFEEEQRTINNLRLLSLMDARLKAVRFSNYKIIERRLTLQSGMLIILEKCFPKVRGFYFGVVLEPERVTQPQP